MHSCATASVVSVYSRSGASASESQVRALQQAARRVLDRNDARPSGSVPM